MCSWNSRVLILHEKRIYNFSTWISEANENVYLFVSLLWLVSFGVCIYIQNFFDVVRMKLQAINFPRLTQKKIKTSRKE